MTRPRVSGQPPRRRRGGKAAQTRRILGVTAAAGALVLVGVSGYALWRRGIPGPAAQEEPAGQGPPAPLVATLSAYWPVGPDASEAERRMEGGDHDRKGRQLCGLQDYLAGQAPYVSVAADPEAFPYGEELQIRELEQRYGQRIVFRVVDTGQAFLGKKTSRLDIRVASKADGYKPELNGTVHYVRLGRTRERVA